MSGLLAPPEMGDVECSDTTGDNKDIDRRIHCVNKDRLHDLLLQPPHELRVKMLGVSARPRRNLGTFMSRLSCSGTYCALVSWMRLTLLLDIDQYWRIAHMNCCLRAPKSLSLKILPLNPYNSEILMPTRRELHCFHRPGGGGYPHQSSAQRGWRNRAIARRGKMRYEPGRSSPRHSPVQCRTLFRSSWGVGGRMARSSRGR